MNVEEKVRKIIVEQLAVSEEEVKPGASFVDDLGADGTCPRHASVGAH